MKLKKSAYLQSRISFAWPTDWLCIHCVQVCWLNMWHKDTIRDIVLHHNTAELNRWLLIYAAGKMSNSLTFQRRYTSTTKGQLISKRLFAILEFFQKNERNNWIIVLSGKKPEFVRSVFGRIISLKENITTLSDL